MTGVFKDGAYYPLLSGGNGDNYPSVDFFEENLSDHVQDARDFEDRLSFEAETKKHKEALELHLDGPFPGEWKVRGGAIIKIAAMETSHLDNAIRYFERAALGEHPKILELKEERKRR